MKITDSTAKINKDKDEIEHYTLVIFANKFEDLPISQKVGDIIRIHRASYQHWKGTK